MWNVQTERQFTPFSVLKADSTVCLQMQYVILWHFATAGNLFGQSCRACGEASRPKQKGSFNVAIPPEKGGSQSWEEQDDRPKSRRVFWTNVDAGKAGKNSRNCWKI